MTRDDAPARQGQQVMTGAQALVRALEELGVTDIFGMPGGAILPFYDPLLASTKIRHVLVRHEQGAGHAAEGYAMVTGRPGVCVATSGPGATNLITPIGDAHMDSVPMLAITGQVGTPWNRDGRLPGGRYRRCHDALRQALLPHHPFGGHRPVRGRGLSHRLHRTPGPVLIDISKDAQEGPTEFVWPPARDLPGYRLPGKPNQRRLAQAAEVISAAERPVLYLGGGLNRAQVPTEDLTELVELIGAPFVTTLTALDVMPSEHPLNLGMPGMHGTVAAVGALQRADVVVCLGARFDDRVTGRPDTFATKASVIHVDVDPAEISKIRTADVPIVGDLADVVPALSTEFRDHVAAEGRADIAPWRGEVGRIQATYPTGWTDTDDGLLQPQEVITHLDRAASEDTIWVTGVGQHQMWSAHYLTFRRPHTWLTSARRHHGLRPARRHGRQGGVS